MQSDGRPGTANSQDPDSGTRSQPGRNWSRSSRRSAPHRITAISDASQYLSVPIGYAVTPPNAGPGAPPVGTIGTGASNVTRRRLPVVRSVDRRNFDLSNVNTAASRRRRAREAQTRQNGAIGITGYEESAGRRRSSVRIAPSVTSGETRSEPTRPGSPEEEEEDEGRFNFPPMRQGTDGLFHSGTGDIVDDDGDDSDSSYASFTDLMIKKSLFSSNTSSDQDGFLFDGLGDIEKSQTAGTINEIKGVSTGSAEEKSVIPTVWRVYRSYYTGEVFSTGALKGNLKTGTNKAMSQRELTRPLFRWIHLVNQNMAFQNFSQFALGIPWLTEGQKKSIDSILKTAKSKSDRSLNNIANANPVVALTGAAAVGPTKTAKKGSYIEPEYYEESVRQTVYQGFRSRRQKTETIRWLCIPYFFVREPEEDRRVGVKKRGTDHSFPTDYKDTTNILLPLLDVGFVSEGTRFQVAQLWILIIGESLILTCARRPVEDLMRMKRPNELSEEVIDIQTLPPANPDNRASGDRAPVIIVSDGGLRTWLLPVDKCLHWPEFTANFAELGVDLFDGWDLLYQDYKLTSQDWPRLIARAKKTSVRLVLEKKDEPDDSEDEDSDGYDSDEEDDDYKEAPTPLDASVPDIKTPDTTTAGASTTEISTVGAAADSTGQDLKSSQDSLKQENLEKESQIAQWHVFTLLAVTPASIEVVESSSTHPHSVTARMAVDDNVLKEDADDIDHYLSMTNRRTGEKEAYRNCRGSTYEQVRQFARTIKTDEESDPYHVNADRLRLIKSARHMFTFFYPLTFDHIVTQKFWGAILRIIQADQPNWAYFRARIRRIRYIHHVIDNLKEELFSRRSPEYNTTNVPHEFIQAFIMLLMFLIMFSTDQAKRTADYTKRTRLLLAQGKFKVIRRLQTVSLREKEAVLPLGVACLLIGKLLENARGDQEFTDRQRLLAGYYGDLQRLTDQVRDDPLSRKYQGQFVSMKTEFESVLSTIEDQQRVLVALDDGITELEAKSVVSPIGQESRVRSRESIVLETTMENAEQTLYSFVQMERRRAELESWHFRTIEIAKDRQEKAALTFTTVTVLCLPLTLLASIFGMNTVDIRNLEESQWIFWLTAGPMSVIALIMWLAYLGTITKWWKRFKRSQKKESTQW